MMEIWTREGGLNVATMDGYVVTGVKQSGPNKETAWKTLSWLDRNEPQSFFVVGSEFRFISTNTLAHQPSVCVLSGVLESINERERNAVLGAISKWESREEQR